MNQLAEEKVELSTKPRSIEVKAKHLRHDGQTPLVLYGKKVTNQNLVADASVLATILREHGTTSLIDLKIDEQKPIKVLIREPQYHPVTHTVLHADLLQVDMSQKITTAVPVIFAGVSPAVEDLGGSLIETKAEVEVECLPQDLPHELSVDISALKTFEDVLHVKDLVIPKGVEILDEAEEVLASVAEPRSEEELAALDEEIEEKIDEVEVEGKTEEETSAEEASEEAPTDAPAKEE